MIFDSHLHTVYSEDSNTVLKDYIVKAGSLGIGITVTDHYDLCNPGPHRHQPGVPDCAKLFSEYAPLRCDSLCVGIELGMEAGACTTNRAVAEGWQWDYILGSLHVMDDMNIYFFDLMCGGRTQQEIYDRYFRIYADTLKQHDFVHAVGHIDHICRYNDYPDKNLSLAKYGEAISCLFSVMAERELAIEINTKRFSEPGAEESLLPLLKRYREMGGKYFTVGSDAHNLSMLGFRLPEAYEMGRLAGLRAVVFRTGRMEYI